MSGYEFRFNRPNRPGGNPPRPFPDPAAIWQSTDPQTWQAALDRYWHPVPAHRVDLEWEMEHLDAATIRDLDPEAFYAWLHDRYFPWKYTAANRLATTRAALRAYRDLGDLAPLATARARVFEQNPADTAAALRAARAIRGLGTAGASGLLALLFPRHFGTVDRFVLEALRRVPGLPEAAELARVRDGADLTIAAGATLVHVMRRKAAALNDAFGTAFWSPRRIDQVLWACR